MSNGTISTFSVGSILVRGFQVLRRNLAPFGTLSAFYMLTPLVISLIFEEQSWLPFVQGFGLTLAAGFLFWLIMIGGSN